MIELRDPNLRVTKTADKLVFQFGRGKNLTPISLLVVLGICSILLALSLQTGPLFATPRAAFAQAILLLTLAGTAYFFVGLIVNRQRVVATPGKIEIGYVPLPFRPRRAVDVSGVKQFVFFGNSAYFASFFWMDSRNVPQLAFGADIRPVAAFQMIRELNSFFNLAPCRVVGSTSSGRQIFNEFPEPGLNEMLPKVAARVQEANHIEFDLPPKARSTFLRFWPALILAATAFALFFWGSGDSTFIFLTATFLLGSGCFAYSGLTALVNKVVLSANPQGISVVEGPLWRPLARPRTVQRSKIVQVYADPQGSQVCWVDQGGYVGLLYHGPVGVESANEIAMTLNQFYGLHSQAISLAPGEDEKLPRLMIASAKVTLNSDTFLYSRVFNGPLGYLALVLGLMLGACAVALILRPGGSRGELPPSAFILPIFFLASIAARNLLGARSISGDKNGIVVRTGKYFRRPVEQVIQVTGPFEVESNSWGFEVTMQGNSPDAGTKICTLTELFEALGVANQLNQFYGFEAPARLVQKAEDDSELISANKRRLHLELTNDTLLGRFKPGQGQGFALIFLGVFALIFTIPGAYKAILATHFLPFTMLFTLLPVTGIIACFYVGIGNVVNRTTIKADSERLIVTESPLPTTGPKIFPLAGTKKWEAKKWNSVLGDSFAVGFSDGSYEFCPVAVGLATAEDAEALREGLEGLTLR